MISWHRIFPKKDISGKPRLVGMSGGKQPPAKPNGRKTQEQPKVASRGLIAPLQPYIAIIRSDIKTLLRIDEKSLKDRETYADFMEEHFKKT